MTVKINADTSDGLKLESDTSGAIDLQSNGVTKVSFDASGNLNTLGRITHPSQPGFLASQSAEQSNFATGYTTIIFDTESYDIGSNYNTSTYTFTAPVDGRYLFTATLGMKNLPVNAQWFLFQIVYTGGTISDNQSTGQWDGNSDTNRTTSFRCSGIADIDANDTVFCRFYQYTGTAQADTANSITHTQFSGILLG